MSFTPHVVNGTAALAAGVERVGLGYKLTADTVSLAVDRLRVRSGETIGELTVREGERHLSRASFNLSSLTARTATAKALGAKESTTAWADLLERLCLGVLDAERRGPGVEMIGGRRRVAEPPHLIDPILPECQSAVLFAPGVSGKSTIATALAVSAAAGAEVVPGWRPAYSCTPLILDYETTAEEWSNRMAAIAEGAGLEIPEIPYLRCERPLPDLIDRIAAVVSDRCVGLVVVDSVTLAMGAGREGSGAEDGIVRLHAALRELAVTALLVDHVNAEQLQSATNGATRPYGSVFKLNLARSVWELRREQEPSDGVTELLLRCVKRNAGRLADDLQLRMIHRNGAIRFESGEVTAPDLEGRLSTRDRMRRLLAAGGLTTKDLSQRLELPESSIRTAITRHPQTFIRLDNGRVALRAHP